MSTTLRKSQKTNETAVYESTINKSHILDWYTEHNICTHTHTHRNVNVARRSFTFVSFIQSPKLELRIVSLFKSSTARMHLSVYSISRLSCHCPDSVFASIGFITNFAHQKYEHGYGALFMFTVPFICAMHLSIWLEIHFEKVFWSMLISLSSFDILLKNIRICNHWSNQADMYIWMVVSVAHTYVRLIWEKFLFFSRDLLVEF